MGRRLMRVPLNFKWPRGMTWKGYINPYWSQKCGGCDGSGLNEATKKLSDEWYTHVRKDGRPGWGKCLEQEDVDALVANGRLYDFTHTWAPGVGWKPKDPPVVPTADEVNAWNARGMGHDGINHWVCVKARAKRMGFYGDCPYCKGVGEIFQTPEIKKLHNKWKSFEPPTGKGFQLWETTSEGSPVSPVFKTMDELCEWAATNATTFGSQTATKEQWREMLDDDFVVHKVGNMVFM